MKFGCFVDLKGKFFDTVFFPQVLKQYPLQGKGCYYMMGKIFLEFGYPSIEVIKMKKMEFKSRDEYVVEKIEISNTIEVPFLKRLLSCHLIQNKKLPKNRKPSLPERLSPPYRNNQFLNPK